jgi:uncharacterized membrane protein YdjX (TVP38/TMEM64 family)
MKTASDIVSYIKDHPYEAIAIIILLYIFFIVFLLPITVLHLMVAYAYCMVFNDFWYGFLFATWVIFVGCMLGALVVLFLGRYIIADYIRRKIDRSRSSFATKFRAVDTLFITNGILIVALLRLMFISFGLTSYVIAVTSISILAYMIGTSFYLIKIMLIVLVGCSIWKA